MFLSNLFRSSQKQSRNHRQPKRLLGFERLEDRTLLSVSMANQEVIVDYSETGIPEGPPMAAYTGPGSEPLATVDEGDFYYYFDEQIPLDRVADQVLIRVDPAFNAAEVVDALTGSGGALDGFEGIAFNDPRLIALSVPFGSEVEVPADILAAAASEDGVLWSMPVFVVEDSRDFVYLTGEIIVALEEGVDPATFFASGFDDWQPFFQNQYIATPFIGGGLDALFAANNLSTDPDVEWATPNFYTNFEVAAAPNDPLFTNQWHLNNTGQNNALIGADAELVDAWGTTTGGTGIVVAVLDNGVQLNHPDFSVFTNTGEIAGNGIDDDGNGFIDDVNGWNFVPTGVGNNNPNPVSADDNHGTAVAGIAAAVGNNNVGVSGAIQTSRILPIKIAQDPGNGGGFIAFEKIARAVYYAAGAVLDANGNVVDTWRGADILVNSWGGGTNNAALTAAFDWAANNGRNGGGVTSFNATGNAAAGTQPGLNYSSLTLNGVTPGNWQFEWQYVKNATNAAGEDSVWLGNVQFPNGTAQRFDAPVLPAGWTTGGNVAWGIVDDPQHTYGTGRYAARAGTIGNNQTSNLHSPVINVTVTGALRFNYWISSETAADGLVLYASLNGGAFVSQFSTSGVPLITTNVNYPASINSTIAVGASTDWDYRSHYSQYGTTLDFVAPSGGGHASITTTDRTGTNGYSSTDYTSTFSGTSAATPLAAGIGALVLSRNTDLTTADIRAILQNTADKIGGNNGLAAYNVSGFNQFYGFGRVNAEVAVEAVPVASGDYNQNGVVDAADYTAWRDTLGRTGLTYYSGADGNGDGQITQADHSVWKSHFGQTVTPPLGSGSIASESVLASASQSLQQSVPLVSDGNPAELTGVGFVDLAEFDLDLFPATTAPIGNRIAAHGLVRQGHLGRSALADVSVRQDEGLLAWLSVHSTKWSDEDIECSWKASKSFADDMDQYHNFVDSPFESLEPFVRSAVRFGVPI
jgi:subtilisin family serine protease